MDLVEAGDLLLELQQLRLAGGGHDHVEVEVIEPGVPPPLVGQVWDVLLHEVRLGPAVAVLDEGRALQDQAGRPRHLEHVVREHQHGVRVDDLLGQADQCFCDSLYRAQGTPPFSAWLLTGSAGDVSEAQSGGYCSGALSSSSTVFQKKTG